MGVTQPRQRDAEQLARSKGVAAGRFMIEGRGSREPVAPNDTAANKAKNRRVEIYVAEPAPAAQQ